MDMWKIMSSICITIKSKSIWKENCRLILPTNKKYATSYFSAVWREIVLPAATIHPRQTKSMLNWIFFLSKYIKKWVLLLCDYPSWIPTQFLDDCQNGWQKHKKFHKMILYIAQGTQSCSHSHIAEPVSSLCKHFCDIF